MADIYRVELRMSIVPRFAPDGEDGTDFVREVLVFVTAAMESIGLRLLRSDVDAPRHITMEFEADVEGQYAALALIRNVKHLECENYVEHAGLINAVCSKLARPKPRGLWPSNRSSRA